VKRSQWAPVYLQVKLLRPVVKPLKLRIEAYDSDDVRTTLEVPLAKTLTGVLPGTILTHKDFAYLPYVRAGDRTGDVRLTLISDDADEEFLAKPFLTRNLNYDDAASYVVVGLGANLPGFDLPSANQNVNNTTRGGLRNGRVTTVAMTALADMPDQWFGWQTADLVVLPTGSTPLPFMLELFGDNVNADQKARRDALLEWVRRGGKLVVSVGSNGTTLAQLKAFQAILPAPLLTSQPLRQVSAMPLYATLPGTSINDDLLPKTAGTKFPIAQCDLKQPLGGRPFRSLIPLPGEERNRAGEASPPAVLQSFYGLGRVTLVLFDLDQSPFLDYPNRPQFWDWLLREAGSAKSALAPQGTNNSYSWSIDNEDEWAATLRRHVDTFDGVPVVSFGWVALFILFYTILIGPVEYLVLKYVFKRLEWTWFTFPLIVLTVSAAAYVTAYAIKGNDLKINKVDVVDLDAQGGRIYGRSYFTIFSPRIDSYTLGIEPNEGWSVGAPPVPPLVGWMAGGSGGGGSLVSRGYSYAQEGTPGTLASGLAKVPIQVWSTKAFSAEWSGTMDPGTPLIQADLYHPPGNPKALVGSFVSNLPVDSIEKASLLYAGKVYKLPTILPGQRVEVPATGLLEESNWFNAAASVSLTQDPLMNSRFNRGVAPPPGFVSQLNLFGALFHERVHTAGKPLNNASLRALDMTWRIEDSQRPRFYDEAILLFDWNPPVGPTESLMSGPRGASASRLWLRGLPGGPKPREAIPGTIRQETFVRVFLPIRSAAPAN
jgi:hypothetical protein